MNRAASHSSLNGRAVLGMYREQKSRIKRFCFYQTMQINENDLNKGWWHDRLHYQGIVPPVPRSELDFDPGSKSHIAKDMPYIK